MPKSTAQATPDTFSDWSGGIGSRIKNLPENQYAFGRSIDYRSDPRRLTILPRSVKESGSVVLDLPMAADRVGTDIYYYGDGGRIYKRTNAGSHSLLRTVANSHGNGMKYYGEDDFLYYTRDKVIGRYGQISGTPVFVDDFLGSEGGVPLNTHSLDLEASSSQYAAGADSASTSITGDLAIECSIKPESLPAAGSSMVLFSKWNVNGNIRSYKFEVYGVSGYFGDGSDGALTISSDTTEAPIDSACTGTSGTTSLSATNASFAAGQVILIHQTRGTGAGTWQKNKIASYTAGTITLETALNAAYVSGAQVRVLKQYTNVTIDSTKTYTAKAWDGTVGGILGFLANGTVTVTGTATATGKGFRGATTQGGQGEGTSGAGNTVSTAANGNGGGGGNPADTTYGAAGTSHGGGGGGHGTAGANGVTAPAVGIGGSTSGTADLTTMTFGGGGGRGGHTNGNGGDAGGAIFIAATTLTISGAVTARGSNGQAGLSPGSGGGGGAGGSVLLKAQTATLGSSLIVATGGTGGSGSTGAGDGGAGGTGRIHLDYYTSYTGTTSPTVDVTQDNTLVTNTTYQLRLGLSSNGTAEEFLTKNTTITTGTWFHVGVSWDASDSQAEFFQDGVSLGSSTGAVTSLNNNASLPAIGADYNSTARNFFDGKIDEVRLWNTERTAAQMLANKGVEIATNAAGLAAYYQLDNTADDSTTNANNLTTRGSPVYSTDVPFSSPTGRLDLDQSLDTSGDVYALPTAISETAANRQTFVPSYDPQKSIEVNISAVGTSANWTITVHDAQNRVVATKTVANASLNTGDFEFVFDDVWRPVIGASYHFHLTATNTTGTPAVVTTTNANLETADFHSYFQFLVEEDFHPLEQMVNVLAIGNERYLATYDAAGTYNPHALTFPAGWHVRCFAKWREYLAIGCWRGGNIYDTDRGIIFFWDGYSPTYNFYIEVPEGEINALFSAKGTLYAFAGYHGSILAYQGGDSAEVVDRIPKLERADYIEILPNAVTMLDGMLRIGVGGASDSSDVERGAYTLGRFNREDPFSLSYDYPISTGTRESTGVKIGLLFADGGQLHMGWKDNVSYGWDFVDIEGSPYATATVEQAVKDYGDTWKEKKGLLVRADFEPLASGESVRVKYKLDRADDWTEGAYETTAGKTKVRLAIDKGNAREIQIAADLATSTTTSPALLELGVEIEPKSTEEIY